MPGVVFWTAGDVGAAIVGVSSGTDSAGASGASPFAVRLASVEFGTAVSWTSWTSWVSVSGAGIAAERLNQDWQKI